jgi:hypothetical protein
MKKAPLLLALFAALATPFASGSDDKPWLDDPVIVSEQTLNNVVVVSNPSPFQVIVSIDESANLRIDTTQPIPRKLAPHEYVKLMEALLWNCFH